MTDYFEALLLRHAGLARDVDLQLATLYGGNPLEAAEDVSQPFAPLTEPSPLRQEMPPQRDLVDDPGQEEQASPSEERVSPSIEPPGRLTHGEAAARAPAGRRGEGPHPPSDPQAPHSPRSSQTRPAHAAAGAPPASPDIPATVPQSAQDITGGSAHQSPSDATEIRGQIPLAESGGAAGRQEAPARPPKPGDADTPAPSHRPAALRHPPGSGPPTSFRPGAAPDRPAGAPRLASSDLPAIPRPVSVETRLAPAATPTPASTSAGEAAQPARYAPGGSADRAAADQATAAAATTTVMPDQAAGLRGGGLQPLEALRRSIGKLVSIASKTRTRPSATIPSERPDGHTQGREPAAGLAATANDPRHPLTATELPVHDDASRPQPPIEAYAATGFMGFRRPAARSASRLDEIQHGPVATSSLSGPASTAGMPAHPTLPPTSNLALSPGQELTAPSPTGSTPAASTEHEQERALEAGTQGARPIIPAGPDVFRRTSWQADSVQGRALPGPAGKAEPTSAMLPDTRNTRRPARQEATQPPVSQAGHASPTVTQDRNDPSDPVLKPPVAGASRTESAKDQGLPGRPTGTVDASGDTGGSTPRSAVPRAVARDRVDDSDPRGGMSDSSHESTAPASHLPSHKPTTADPAPLGEQRLAPLQHSAIPSQQSLQSRMPAARRDALSSAGTPDRQSSPPSARAPAPFSAPTSSVQDEQVIVTIERLELRAAASARQPRQHRPPARRIGLDEYAAHSRRTGAT